jgi:hypothetical protein
MNSATGVLTLASSNTADIGTYNYTMTESLASYPLVTPVIKTFSVTITCAVTSFTISTSVTNFNYILNSGNIVSGPFNPVQVNPCNYPVTYNVEHFQGSTDLGSATNLFSTGTLSYTHSFTDPALIGTIQTYILTASITVPGIGVMNATNTLNITIQPDCLNTALISTTINDMNIAVNGSTTQNMIF